MSESGHINVKKSSHLFNKHNDLDFNGSSMNSINMTNEELNEGDDDDSLLELDTDPEQNGEPNYTSKRNLPKVNPFCPSSFKPKMSFERRRWAHAFPLRSDGTPIYDHWTSVQTNTETPIYIGTNNLNSLVQCSTSLDNQKSQYLDSNEINKNQRKLKPSLNFNLLFYD